MIDWRQHQCASFHLPGGASVRAAAGTCASAVSQAVTVLHGTQGLFASESFKLTDESLMGVMGSGATPRCQASIEGSMALIAA